MKKLITFSLLLALTIPIAVGAQTTATYRDAAAWDAVTNTSAWTITGYDVVLSQTNVVATQLGTTNGVPALAGIVGNTRVGVTNTEAGFKTFLASNPVASPYTLWARTVTTQVGATNVVVSDWTSIPVKWVDLPPIPANLRVRPFGP